MKILIATPNEGGPFTYTKLLEKELSQQGVSVKVCSFGEVLHLPKVVRHLVFFFKLVFSARGAQVLYAQDPASTGLPTLCAARLMGKTFLLRVAGDYAWEQGQQFFGITDTIDAFQKKYYSGRVGILRRIQRFVAEHADYVITPSNYFSSIVEQWGIIHPIVIYNGIELGVLPQMPSVTIPPKTIVSVGRLVPWKGFDALIDLMQELPEWHLCIVGEGEMHEELVKRAKRLGVLNRVSFFGKRSREEIYAIFQEAEVFVLNTAFESFSFLAVEAMDAGIPLVAGRAGSIPELVREGVDGLLVEPNNVLEIKHAIEKIAADTGMRESLITNARKRAKEFTIERTARAVMHLLEKNTP